MSEEAAKKEPKRALITGITGQDGSYLAELLLSKGYTVHGIVRRSSSPNTVRIVHIVDRLQLHYGDVADGTVLRRIVEEVHPHELYNLAAQSDVRMSFLVPEYTGDVTALGVLRLLDVVRDVELRHGWRIRVYQAGSSEMFGSTPPPQSESTPFHPRSPYAVAKLSAHWFAVNYRESYGMFVCNGILFNHESPRRGELFVTRKITRAAARISLGLQKTLYLGNLEARRDWGFAGDYVAAMWAMLQREAPDDYVVATGEAHSVQEFVEEVFGLLGLSWREHVRIDPGCFRPAEVDYLQGDWAKAERELGWKPATSFKELVKMMLDHDLELARREKLLAPLP